MSRDHYFFRIKMVVGNDEDPSDFKLSGSFKFENFLKTKKNQVNISVINSGAA